MSLWQDKDLRRSALTYPPAPVRHAAARFAIKCGGDLCSDALSIAKRAWDSMVVSSTPISTFRVGRSRDLYHPADPGEIPEFVEKDAMRPDCPERVSRGTFRDYWRKRANLDRGVYVESHWAAPDLDIEDWRAFWLELKKTRRKDNDAADLLHRLVTRSIKCYDRWDEESFAKYEHFKWPSRLCSLCRREPESLQHLYFECESSLGIWRLVVADKRRRSIESIISRPPGAQADRLLELARGVYAVHGIAKAFRFHTDRAFQISDTAVREYARGVQQGRYVKVKHIL